jgi:bisphosphoglycerate-dependent phosphoglycerate mutase
MTGLNSENVVDFGKVIFVRRNHTVPALPDMNLIVLKKENVFQAICIDIEIDATGNNLKECCYNLKKALLSYLMQMIDNYNGNIKAAAEDIINAAYAPGDIKSQLFVQYIQAKRQYILDKISKENKAKSRKDELINAWKRTFQIKPIRLDLTMAAIFT